MITNLGQTHFDGAWHCKDAWLTNDRLIRTVSVPPIALRGSGLEFSTLCIGQEATLVCGHVCMSWWIEPLSSMPY